MTLPYAACRRAAQWAIGWVLLLAAVIQAPLVQAQPAQARSTQAPRSFVADDPRVVLVMGDSLSAAYGLSASEGWVALTAQRMAERHPGWTIVNASISGETTAGGAARIVDAVVRHRPSVVVIELGANDALRGLPLRESRRNLARMIGAAQGIGAKVLLVGMRMPPNLGRDYTQEFERGYRELSRRFGTALLPFLLEPIAGDRANFQGDNLHPVAGAQAKIRDHVWPALDPLLDQ
jgi:acyl-CoA thioesterase-1